MVTGLPNTPLLAHRKGLMCWQLALEISVHKAHLLYSSFSNRNTSLASSCLHLLLCVHSQRWTLNCAVQMKKGTHHESCLRRQTLNQDQPGVQNFSRGDSHERVRRGEGAMMQMQQERKKMGNGRKRDSEGSKMRWPLRSNTVGTR